MKFKTKEDLNKDFIKIAGTYESPSLYNGFEEGLDFAFKSFAERAVFCKKYIHSRFTLMSDYPNIYEEYLIYAGRMEYTNEHLYRQWLLDYCFGDVME